MLSLNQSVNLTFAGISSPLLNAAFGFATWLFNPVPFCVLLVLSIWVMWKWSAPIDRRWNALLFIIAPVSAVVISWVLKIITDVPRPIDARFHVFGPSFPSLHTAVATAYFLVLLHFARRAKDPLRRAVHYAFCVLCSVMVGVSRLYFGVHWLSDVLVGYVVGGIAVYLTLHVFLKKVYNT